MITSGQCTSGAVMKCSVRPPSESVLPSFTARVRPLRSSPSLNCTMKSSALALATTCSEGYSRSVSTMAPVWSGSMCCTTR